MGWFTDNILGIDDSGGLSGSAQALAENPLKFFQYATGSATEGGKRITNEVDDFVNENIPGGWVTVAAVAAGGYILLNPATGAAALSSAPATATATAGQVAAAGGAEAVAASAGATLGAGTTLAPGVVAASTPAVATAASPSAWASVVAAGKSALSAINSPAGQVVGNLISGGLGYLGDKEQAKSLSSLSAQDQSLTEAYGKGREITDQKRLQAIENYKWELSKNTALSNQEKEQATANYERQVSSATGAGYQALGQKFEGEGAGYRKRLADLYADPSSFLSSAEVQQPLQQGTDMLARSLSTGGNPIGSGNALQELQGFTSKQLFGRLGEEKGRLASLGYDNPFYRSAPGAYTAGVAPTAAGSVDYKAPLQRTNDAPLEVAKWDPSSPYAGPSSTAGQFAMAGAQKTGDMYGGLAELSADIFKPRQSAIPKKRPSLAELDSMYGPA